MHLPLAGRLGVGLPVSSFRFQVPPRNFSNPRRKTRNMKPETQAACNCLNEIRFADSVAEVVKWQTRTFEGRVAQAVRVQVPPSAPTQVSSFLPHCGAGPHVMARNPPSSASSVSLILALFCEPPVGPFGSSGLRKHYFVPHIVRNNRPYRFLRSAWTMTHCLFARSMRRWYSLEIFSGRHNA